MLVIYVSTGDIYNKVQNGQSRWPQEIYILVGSTILQFTF